MNNQDETVDEHFQIGKEGVEEIWERKYSIYLTTLYSIMYMIIIRKIYIIYIYGLKNLAKLGILDLVNQ